MIAGAEGDRIPHDCQSLLYGLFEIVSGVLAGFNWRLRIIEGFRPVSTDCEVMHRMPDSTGFTVTCTS